MAYDIFRHTYASSHLSHLFYGYRRHTKSMEYARCTKFFSMAGKCYFHLGERSVLSPPLFCFVNRRRKPLIKDFICKNHLLLPSYLPIRC